MIVLNRQVEGEVEADVGVGEEVGLATIAKRKGICLVTVPSLQPGDGVVGVEVAEAVGRVIIARRRGTCLVTALNHPQEAEEVDAAVEVDEVGA